MKILVLLFLFIVVCMAGTVVVFEHFGWTGLATVAVVLIVGLLFLKRLLGWLFVRLLTTPFRKKGAVLENATIEVHHITPADPPDRRADFANERALLADGDEDDEMIDDEEDAATYLQEMQDFDTASDWYRIDVTVTPASAEQKRETTPFQMWEPAELLLVPYDFRGNTFDAHQDEIGGTGVHSVQIWRDGVFQEDFDGKYAGAQRLCLHVGVPRGCSRMKFLYYFNTFGDLELPTFDV